MARAFCRTEPVENDAVHHHREQNTQACVGVVVDNDVVHVGNLLSGQFAAVSNLLFVLIRHEEEAFHLRVGAEQFQTQRPWCR